MSDVPRACTLCGKCKEVCLVEELSSSVENTVLEREEKFLCANCWKCMEVCPEQIDIYALMMEARRKGELPESFRMSIKNIVDTGYSMPMRGIASIREMYGLEAIEEPRKKVIKRLLRSTAERLRDG